MTSPPRKPSPARSVVARRAVRERPAVRRSLPVRGLVRPVPGLGSSVDGGDQHRSHRDRTGGRHRPPACCGSVRDPGVPDPAGRGGDRRRRGRPARPIPRLRRPGAHRAGDAPRPPGRRLGVGGLGGRRVRLHRSPGLGDRPGLPVAGAAVGVHHQRAGRQGAVDLRGLRAAVDLAVPAVAAARGEGAGGTAGRNRVVRAAAAAADRPRVELVLARHGDDLDGTARGRGHRLGRRAGGDDDLPGQGPAAAGDGVTEVQQAGDLVCVHRRADRVCSTGWSSSRSRRSPRCRRTCGPPATAC